uniref:Uncharacterized protein n=1 Tax=Panagrolaimus superbus TaxID=310955 RepID=A0A914Z2D5_9BILA
MVYRKAIRALIADDCNVETMEIARLSYFWNIPIFLRSGNSLDIFNSDLFPTSIQFDDTTAISIALTLKSLAFILNESEMVLVGPKQTNMKNVPLYIGIHEYLKQISTINITNVLAMEEANWGNMVSNIDKMKTKTKFYANF